MINQTVFHEGLLNPSLPIPDGLTDGHDRPAGRRYGVYRNNVTVSLRDALAEGFPSIVGLIGRENFDHVARAFLRSTPPTSPLMMHYGAELPDFIYSLKQLAHLPYLADAARIDLYMRQSYHAADSTGIDASILQKMDEEMLLSTRLTIAPSTFLVRSQWPTGSIWKYTLRNGEKPKGDNEDILILRAEFDPEPYVLGSGAADVLTTWQNGTPFGEAIEVGGDAFDLGALLSLLLTHNAITSVTP